MEAKGNTFLGKVKFIYGVGICKNGKQVDVKMFLCPDGKMLEINDVTIAEGKYIWDALSDIDQQDKPTGVERTFTPKK